VRKTGGLADTVHDYDSVSGEGDGFVFEDYTSTALISTVKRAIETYQQKAIWSKLQKKGMGYDYSWNNSAKKYVSLYMKALAKIGLEPL
jgi:starch synthase